MSKIGSDNSRFKDIIKGKVKNNLKKFVSSGNILGQQGNKTVKIPIHSIDLPRFIYGSNSGGTGSGDGNEGDPVDGQGKSSGKGKAGSEKGEHDFSAEFSQDELAELIIEHLELPNLEDKGKAKIHAEKNKYNSISNNGPEGLKHFKRTYKEALKRNISSGIYDPLNPKIIPIRDDKRYKHYSVQEEPNCNTVVIFSMDCSGSMGQEQKRIAEIEVFWIELLLKHSYKNIETVFIVHDVEAQEVNREDFFKISSSGGTRISSSLDLCADIMEERYPFSEWNAYLFSISDGDSGGSSDDNKCEEILKNRILPNCNQFSYGQVKSNFGSGEFIDYLETRIDDEKMVLTEINSTDDILNSIKKFFEKGK